MNTQTKLKRIMEAKGLTANALAEMSEVPQPTISRILNGNHGDPRTNTLAKLASALGCTVAELRGDEIEGQLTAIVNNHTIPGNEVTTARPVRQVPLITWAVAAKWPSSTRGVDKKKDETVTTSYQGSTQLYALRVQGDSMEPKFPDGCTIFIEPDETPKHGSFVIVKKADLKECILRQFVSEGAINFLKPINPDYKNMIIQLGKSDLVCGVVKHVAMDV